MRILVDTNILVRLANPADPQRDLAIAAIATIASQGHMLCLAPQSYYEYWVVATRPAAQNGLGMTSEAAFDDLAKFDSDFELLPESPELLPIWRGLVSRYQVQGKPAHDARLGAAMLRHGVTQLITFNAPDFARYAEITAFAPEAAPSFPPAA